MKHLRLLVLLALSPLMQAADIPAPPSPYPLSTCIVSGERLGEMGKPVVIDYKGQQVDFCCKSCVGDFEKDPAKYLAKLPASPAKP